MKNVTTNERIKQVVFHSAALKVLQDTKVSMKKATEMIELMKQALEEDDEEEVVDQKEWDEWREADNRERAKDMNNVLRRD